MAPIPDLNRLYQDWLEIPAHRLPPNHYALLGIDDFESDEAVIEAAAKSRSAYLHQIASGPQRKIVQEMMGQVAIARRTLMSSSSREEYNQSLENGLEVSSGNVHAGESLGPNADEHQTAADHPAGDSSSTTTQRPATHRTTKPTTNWRPHLISVGVLLAVLIGVAIWKRPFSGRSSPVVPRKSQGSGLGSGLDEKFGDVLSEIADETSSSKTEKSGSPPSTPKERP